MSRPDYDEATLSPCPCPAPCPYEDDDYDDSNLTTVSPG